MFSSVCLLGSLFTSRKGALPCVTISEKLGLAVDGGLWGDRPSINPA